MTPSANSRSCWKLPRLKEEIASFQQSGFTVPFIAIVESWLRPENTEAEINIDNYNVYRCDREKVQHGGVLMYIHQNISIDDIVYFNDDQCAAIICLSKRRKCLISCVYRPPTASHSSFSNLLEFLSSYFSLHNLPFTTRIN